MARKRRNSSSESGDLPSPKRARPFSIDDSDLDYEATSAETPRINSTYGQKGAFPGLGGDDGGDELFYGPANDGIEYLRMVRLVTLAFLLYRASQAKICSFPADDSVIVRSH